MTVPRFRVAPALDCSGARRAPQGFARYARRWRALDPPGALPRMAVTGATQIDEESLFQFTTIGRSARRVTRRMNARLRTIALQFSNGRRDDKDLCQPKQSENRLLSRRPILR
jgi:hypothetical protein